MKKIILFFLGFIFYGNSFSQTDSLINVVYKKFVKPYSSSQEFHRGIDSVLKYYPQNAWIWQQKGMHDFKAGKMEEGLPFLNKAADLEPRQYIEYRGFMQCIFAKKYKAALQDFKEAKSKFGENYVMDHPYNFYQGICFLQLNELDSAVHYFQETIRFENKKYGVKLIHYMNWFYLAVAYLELGKNKESNTCLDKTLATYPQFSDAKYYKACLLFKEQKPEKARELLKEALQDLKKGYTINEENERYVHYPYQVLEPSYDIIEAK